jgi:uncharacterized YigZ family protein
MDAYPIPDLAPGAIFRLEDTIRRSRFLVSLAHAPDSAAARAFVESVRREFPDATHNCWAFAAGPPGDTAKVGCSDDGEPHGTAGRPMLTVLLHGEVGEICVVATRYFGGVKLGSGGLVRAYQGMAKLGLAGVPRRPRPFPATPPTGPLTELEVIVGYKRIAPVKRLLPAFSARIEAERFAADAVLRISLPEARAEAFVAALGEAAAGAVLVRAIPIDAGQAL